MPVNTAPLETSSFPTKEGTVGKVQLFSLLDRAKGITEGVEVGGWKPAEAIQTREECERRYGYLGQAQNFLIELGSKPNLTAGTIRTLLDQYDTEIKARVAKLSGSELIQQLSQTCNFNDGRGMKDVSLIAATVRYEVLAGLKHYSGVELPGKISETAWALDGATKALAQRARVLESQYVFVTQETTPEDITKLNEKVSDKEHVFYHSKVAVLGDSHGKGESPVLGHFNVCSGDYVDFKFNLNQLEIEKYKKGCQAWINAVESGDAAYIMGNHDMKFLAAMLGGHEAAQYWLDDGGDLACKAFGINLPNDGRIDVDNYEDFRLTITNAQDKTLYHFYEMLLKHGKFYAIVNDTYIAHTLPVTTPDGSLRAITAGNHAGIEAMDDFEESLRALGNAVGGTIDRGTFDKSVNRILALSRTYIGNSDIHGPLWVREEPLQNIQRNQAVAERLLSDLDKQAQQKGAHIKAAMYGHVMEGGKTDKTGKLINIDFAGRAPGVTELHAFIELQKIVSPGKNADFQAKIKYPPDNLHPQRPVTYKETSFKI